MRKARAKVRKDFTINKPGSEAFMKMLEECDIEREVAEAFNKTSKKKFSKLDAETRMQIVCEKLI